jgi:uncharacterized membrane protein YeaQ/YmgE (transglycosylase-associated protein family)
MRFSDPNTAYWFWIILIGILAGFLAGKLMQGRGFGLIVDLLLGIVGSYIGSWLFVKLGIATSGGFIGQLLVSLVGALLLLFLIRLIRRV